MYSKLNLNQLVLIKLLLQILFLFLISSMSIAEKVQNMNVRDMSELYSLRELKQWQGKYSPNVRGMLSEDIKRYLNADELQTLSATKLDFPLYGSNFQPFDFYSYNGIIEMPILSIKFFDDLAIAYSWLIRHDCQTDAVSDYVAMLYNLKISLKSPLQVLPVPANALNDPYVDDVSQKILKSAMAFVLLHEFAHIHFGHQGFPLGKTLSPEEAQTSQSQEAEADKFALDVMRRMRLPPLGVALWFTAVSVNEPSQTNQHRSHPVTGERLNAIATELRRQPGNFIEHANRGILTEQMILSIAQQIEGIAAILIDDDMRWFKWIRGQQLPQEHLQRACQPNYDEEAMKYLKIE